MAGRTLKDSHGALLIMITQSRALTLEAAGTSPAVSNYCAGLAACPGDGAVSEPGQLLGGGPTSSPSLVSRHVTSHVSLAGPAALSPFLAESLYTTLQRKEVFSGESEEGGKGKHTSYGFLPLFPGIKHCA